MPQNRQAKQEKDEFEDRPHRAFTSRRNLRIWLCYGNQFWLRLMKDRTWAMLMPKRDEGDATDCSSSWVIQNTTIFPSDLRRYVITYVRLLFKYILKFQHTPSLIHNDLGNMSNLNCIVICCLLASRICLMNIEWLDISNRSTSRTLSASRCTLRNNMETAEQTSC